MEKAMTPMRCLLLGVMLLGGMAHAQNRTPAKPAAARQDAVKPDKAKLSYAIGYQIGSQFAGGKPDVEIPVLVRAIQDAYAKHSPSVSMEEMHQQLQALEQRMHNDAVTEFKHVAAENAQHSAEYMASNRRKSGVVELPSGIQYSVIKKGDGKTHALVTSTVTVNYRGMLVDGTEFDSTWAHGSPVSFAVNGVIPGWRDVIPRMYVGDRWKVVIPPKLAYGEGGALPRIGPNEALIFEIELLAIKPDNSGP